MPRPPFAPGFGRGGGRPGFGQGAPPVPQAPAAPAGIAVRPALPHLALPHTDANLTFDFEPAIEEDAVRREAKRVAAIRAMDPRFKTVVCMHWVNGLCMKADKCEFLHEVDVDRMPDCRQGQRCNDKMCAFKHVKDEERPLCNNYRFGFCPHGATCRYQHRKRPAEELPQISEIAFVGTALVGGNADDDDDAAGSGGGGAGGGGGGPVLHPQQQRNPNWRTAMCHSFVHNQTCSFGDSCNYAHSEDEMLRNIAIRNSQFSNASAVIHGTAALPAPPARAPAVPEPAARNAGPPQAPAMKIARRSITPLDRCVVDMRDWTEHPDWPASYVNPTSLKVPHGLQLPDDRALCRYFIMRAATLDPLFPSIKRQKWAVDASVAGNVNLAFASNPGRVFFFFAVDSEFIFSGAAAMQSPFVETEREGWVCDVRWVAACDLLFKKTAYLTSVVPEVGRELPVAMAIEGAELPPSAGRTLMLMLFLEQQIMPPVDGVAEDEPLVVHPLGPAPDVLLAIQNTPIAPPEVGPLPPATPGGQNVAPHAVPVRGPGYVFKVPTVELMDEVLGRGLVGAPNNEFAAVNQVAEPGCIFLIVTTYDAKVHGVFEAISGVEKQWEPTAFEGVSWPAQLKFRVLQPCEPQLEVSFPAYKQQLGIIAPAELQLIVNNLAYRARRGPTLAALKSPVLAAIARGAQIVDKDPPALHPPQPAVVADNARPSSTAAAAAPSLPPPQPRAPSSSTAQASGSAPVRPSGRRDDDQRSSDPRARGGRGGGGGDDVVDDDRSASRSKRRRSRSPSPRDRRRRSPPRRR